MRSTGNGETIAFLVDNEGLPDSQNRTSENREFVERALVADYSTYHRLALKRLGTRTDADDVLHGFCVKALERSHQLRRTDAVHGWLRRLFETTLLDHFRQSSRTRAKTVPLEQSTSAAEDIIGDTAAIDEMEVIRDVLDCLRPNYAQIIRQVDLGQEEPSIVADKLDISHNNLAVRLHRARVAFRHALADMPLAMQE